MEKRNTTGSTRRIHARGRNTAPRNHGQNAFRQAEERLNRYMDIQEGAWTVAFTGQDKKPCSTVFTLGRFEGGKELEQLWNAFARENGLGYNAVTAIEPASCAPPA